MSTFNTLRNDKHTDAQSKTYENILTNQFTRFEVQLIAKYNKISFDWGVTSRDTLITMMRERNLPIPDDETMQTYIRMHRQEANDLAGKTPKKEESNSDEVVDYSKLTRQELIKSGIKHGMKNATTMKSKDIIAGLKFPKRQ